MNLKKRHNIFWRMTLSVILVWTSSFAFAQNAVINGLVTSMEDGQPLISVTVIFKGTSVVTTTDINGRYTIKNNSENSILVFSMVGMKKTEIAVKK